MAATLLGLVLLAAPPPPGLSQPNCGVASAIAILEALRRPVPEDAVRRLTELYPSATVNLDTTAQMVRSLGVAISGYRATLDELAADGRPAIIHLRTDDHFVCLVGVDRAFAQFLDGWPLTFTTMPRAEADARYSGACLLPDEEERDSSPHAVAGQRHAQFAAGEAGQSVVHTFTVANDGDQTLELRASGSSCSCTTVGAARFTIAPGGAVEVPVSLRLVPGRGRLE